MVRNNKFSDVKMLKLFKVQWRLKYSWTTVNQGFKCQRLSKGYEISTKMLMKKLNREFQLGIKAKKPWNIVPNLQKIQFYNKVNDPE